MKTKYLYPLNASIYAKTQLITVATTKGALVVPDQPSMYRFTALI
jgi:hypothetical protein